MRAGKDPNAIRRRLRKLAEMVHAVETRAVNPATTPETGSNPVSGGADNPTSGGGGVPTGWPGVDDLLAGLTTRGIHEWFGLTPGNVETAKRQNGKTSQHRNWMPPLCVLSHLAWQALTQDGEGQAAYVVWIGRRLWPYPRILLRGSPAITRFGITPSPAADPDRTNDPGLLLRRSLFVDPPDDATRLWAIDLALRCPAVVVVIADGRGLRMAETRRLQLAAEAGHALALLARPPAELSELSAATTRWLVSPVPSSSTRPRWSIELLRCKAALQAWHTIATTPDTETTLETTTGSRMTPLSGGGGGGVEHPPTHNARMRRWLLEWSHAQSIVALPADVVDRSHQAAASVGKHSEQHGAAASPARRGQSRRTA